MSHKTELMKNTLIIAVGKIGTQILSFILLSLYTWKITPDEYGTFDFLVTLQLFIIPIVTFLMEEAMFRFLIDCDTEKKKKKVITQTVVIYLMGAFIFTTIATIICAIIKYDYGLPFILYVDSCIFIGLTNSLARGLSKIKLYSFVNFLNGALNILLNVLFILAFSMGASGLLYSIVIANLVAVVVTIFKTKAFKYIDFKNFDKKQTKEMLKYSLPLVPSNLSWLIISLSDRLMLRTFIDSAANGIYAIANKFPYILNTVFSYFNTAWKESASKILKEEDYTKKYNSIYIDTNKLLFAGTICLLAAVPFAFPILIHESYNEAYMFIPPMILATYISCLSNFYGGIFAAFKDTRIMGRTTFLAAFLNVLINVIFIPFIGIWAAVISTFVAESTVYIYRRIYLRKYVNLVRTKKIGPFIVIAIVTTSYYVDNWIVKGIALCLAFAYSIWVNEKELKKLVKKLKKKFKRA